MNTTNLNTKFPRKQHNVTQCNFDRFGCLTGETDWFWLSVCSVLGLMFVRLSVTFGFVRLSVLLPNRLFICVYFCVLSISGLHRLSKKYPVFLSLFLAAGVFDSGLSFLC